MAEEKMSGKEKWHKSKMNKNSSGGGAVYGVGFVGALFYLIPAADSFWAGVVGILQAMVWPAIVVYKLLESFYG